MPETLVVDCSVAAAWMFAGKLRAQARLLIEQVNSGELALIAPDLILAEFASLVTKRVRRKQLSAPEARDLFQHMRHSALFLFESRLLLPAALDLALQHHLSLWDCVYLALAAEKNCPLITADRRLLRGYTPRHPAIRLLS